MSTFIVPLGESSVRPRRARWWATTTVAVLTAALAIGGLVPPTAAVADTAPKNPADITTPETVSTDVLPTPQIGDGLSSGQFDTKGAGVVWDQVVVGDTVYVGGQFGFARPAGAAKGEKVVVRSNFLAYNLKTGALLDYAPSFNGTVLSMAVSIDQKTLYVGGTFTSVNNVTRYRLAAFDVATGALTSFAPSLNASVRAMAISNSTLYIGGVFTSVQKVARGGLAALTIPTGAVTPWQPVAESGTVLALLVSPDESKVIVGGRFLTLNGSDNPGRSMGAVRADTGASLPWKINGLIRNGGLNSGITSLTSSGDSVYGTAYLADAAEGKFEGAFRATWADGTTEWLEDCHGDSYSVAVSQGVAYTVSHAHGCQGVRGFEEGTTNVGGDVFHRALAFSTAKTQTLLPYTGAVYGNYAGEPAPSLLQWYPDLAAGAFTGTFQAAWDVTAAQGYVLMGGEFTKVNGVAQQGLVRFAPKQTAPNKDRPILEAGNMVPTISQWGTTATRLTWPANYDRDNASLTYQLIRDDRTEKPVYTTTTESSFWNRPTISFTDRDCLVPGSSHTYQLRVTDPFGNARWGTKVPYTVPQPATPSTTNAHRALYNGATSNAATVPPGATAVGSNGAYLTPSGDLYVTHMGTAPTAVNVSSAMGAFLDNRPYVAYVTKDKQGGAFAHRIDFDGTTRHYPTVPAGSRTVGANADFLASNGDLYDLAVSAAPVASKVVAAKGLWNAGRGNSMTFITSDSQAGASAHRINPDGSITRFPAVPAGAKPVGGDGHTLASNGDLYVQNTRVASNVTSAEGIWLNGIGTFVSFTTSDLQGGAYAHRYEPAGGISKYPTVPASSTAVGATGDFLTKDGDLYLYMTMVANNVTSAVGQYHSVDGPYVAYTDAPCSGKPLPAVNTAPTAAIASSVSSLTVALDGAGSADSDGSIATYAWDFGDGTTGTGKTTKKTYAKAGSFTVTLTVTDDKGATASATTPVTAATPPAQTSASDDFERTVVAGWGAAPSGGSWSLAGPKTYGVSGGAGTIGATRGHTHNAMLPGYTSAASTTSAVFTLGTAPAGGGQHLSVIGRQIGAENYAARVVIAANGSAELSVLRSATVLKSVKIAGTYVVGQPISIRISVTGTGAATIAASAWMGAGPPPTAWQTTVQDTTASLQQAGTVGITTYTSATGANGTIRVDAFRSAGG